MHFMETSLVYDFLFFSVDTVSWSNFGWCWTFSIVGKLADILEDTQAARFTDKLYVALEDFQLALQKDKAKKRKVEKYCALLCF